MMKLKGSRQAKSGVRWGLAAFICVASLACFPTLASAGDEDKLGLSIRTPVVAGQENPALILTPTVGISSADITVKRKGDGKQFLFNVKGLRKGSSKTLELTQPEGTSSYEAHFDVKFAKGGAASFGIVFEAVSTAGLSVEVTQRDVDLDARTLQFLASRPIASAEVAVFGEGGKELGRATATYQPGRSPKRRSISWNQEPGLIRRIEVKVTDPSGFWTGIEVRAFYVDPWEDRIYFATGSDVIEDSEKGKLESTLDRIRKAIRTAKEEYGTGLDLRLYIAGYTDTVGSDSSNLDLSKRRARSIGRYFSAKGLELNMYYQGFGESVLAVQTPDNTSEERNRRTLYVLSSQTPVSHAFPRANWKRLD